AYYGTQFELLSSRPVLGRVEAALGLPKHPAFAAGGWFGRAGQSSSFEGLDRYIEVTPVKRSRLVRITARVPDADLAAAIPNRVATEYIGMLSQERREASDAAAKWLESQLGGLRSGSEATGGAVQRFVEQNDMVPSQDGKEFALTQLEDLNRAYTEAENDRLQKEARARMLTSADPATAGAALGSDLVRGLQAEEARLEREVARAGTTYGPQHPKMVELQADLANAKKRVETEIGKGRSAVQEEARAAARRAEEVGRRLDAQRQRAITQHVRQMQLTLLKKEADVGATVYADLMKRLKEVQLAAQMRMANVKVVDPAEKPRGRSSPNHPRDLLMGLVGGLLGGVALAFVREVADKTLRTPRDVDLLVRLPSIGAVPTIPGYRRRTLPPVAELPGVSLPGEAPAWPEQMAEEAFRSIRTLVFHRQAPGTPRTMLVTSAEPGEGKSFVAVNLAVALAGTGEPVLLIDADFRRPSCHQVFDLNLPKVGLSSILYRDQPWDGSIVATSVPNLAFLPAGPMPPDPAALLSSERARELLAALRERYAWIIVDSPPVLAASDACALARQVEGVLLVVRANATPIEAAQLVRDRLERLGANVVGVVLNDVRPTRDRYFYANYG
ncbi:MAG: hypothetical protein DMD79_26185, partial [Candidatus Rokuibacteriota bacterium]